MDNMYIKASDMMDASRVGHLLYLSSAPKYRYDDTAKRYTDEIEAINVQCLPIDSGSAPIVVKVPCEAEQHLPKAGQPIRFVNLSVVPYIRTTRGGHSYIALSFKADDIINA